MMKKVKKSNLCMLTTVSPLQRIYKINSFLLFLTLSFHVPVTITASDVRPWPWLDL